MNSFKLKIVSFFFSLLIISGLSSCEAVRTLYFTITLPSEERDRLVNDSIATTIRYFQVADSVATTNQSCENFCETNFPLDSPEYINCINNCRFIANELYETIVSDDRLLQEREIGGPNSDPCYPLPVGNPACMNIRILENIRFSSPNKRSTINRVEIYRLDGKRLVRVGFSSIEVKATHRSFRYKGDKYNVGIIKWDPTFLSNLALRGTKGISVEVQVSLDSKGSYELITFDAQIVSNQPISK
ncbi:MAG: hypothetical protein AAFP89_17045 [Bacteroidota bacterium]